MFKACLIPVPISPMSSSEAKPDDTDGVKRKGTAPTKEQRGYEKGMKMPSRKRADREVCPFHDAGLHVTVAPPGEPVCRRVSR
jgi:hypothetical protein